VLFRATLDEKSGLDIVLQAFKRMRSRVADALLVVTGEGSTEFIARAKRDAKALGLGDEDVFWAEQLSAYGKRAALADADAFVLPSRSDNREVTIVEALGAGVPVVVSERVAMHREVGSKCAGIVVRCEPDEVAHALTIILTRPEFARAMGRWGVELVRQAYSADAVAQQMIDAYCSIAKTATSEDADAAFGEVETAS
jgi:glycosyltransferase involved in cell wall biosynthesis